MVGKFRVWPWGVHSNDKLLEFIMERVRRVPTIHGGGVVGNRTEQNRTEQNRVMVCVDNGEWVCVVFVLCVWFDSCVGLSLYTKFGIVMCVV